MVILLLPNCSLAVQKTYSVREGIVNNEIGQLALSSSSKKVNVIIKIIPPNFVKTCSPFVKYLNTELDTFQKEGEDLMYTLTSPLQTSESNRNKRQLFAIIGATLLAGLSFLTSELQIHSLRSHLHKTQDETNSIKSQLRALSHSTFAFEKNTIGLLKSITSQISAEYNKTNCEIQYIYHKTVLDYYIRHMKIFLNLAALGQLQSTLTTEIIDYISLQKIIAQHKSFKSSMFKSNPSYLYGLASLTLVNIMVKESIIHFIMEYPTIYHHSVANLYYTQQLGLHSPLHNYCVYFDIPTHFFEMEGSAYTIHLNKKCKSHKDLTICTTYKHLLKESCMSTKVMNCTYSTTQCTSNFHFLYTSKGLLVRDNSAESYMTQKTGSIRKVAFNNQSIALIPWYNNVNIFIAQEILVENPGDQYASMTSMTDYGVKLDYIDFYPIDTFNVTQAYAEFYSTENMTPMDTLKSIKGNNFRTIALSITFGILAAISVTIIFVLYTMYRTNTLKYFPKNNKLTWDYFQVPRNDTNTNFSGYRQIRRASL